MGFERVTSKDQCNSNFCDRTVNIRTEMGSIAVIAHTFSAKANFKSTFGSSGVWEADITERQR